MSPPAAESIAATLKEQVAKGKRKRPLEEEEEEPLRGIDASIKRIRKCVPQDPYILTISQAEPRYNHPSTQEAYSWRRGTPFDLNEEYFQYQSLHYREDPECFTQRSRLDLQRDSSARSHHNGQVSGAATPTATPAAKKKISLLDYKNKKAGTRGLPKAEQVDQAVKPEPMEVPINGVATDGRRGSGSDSDENKGNKRMLDEIERDMSSFLDDAPLPKKARAAPSSPKLAVKPLEAKAKAEGNTRGLPPLLSPLGDISSPKKLPPLLSPTLPPEIEAELDRQHTRQRAASDLSASSEKNASKSGEPKPHSAQFSTQAKVADRSPFLDVKPLPRVSADDLIEEGDKVRSKGGSATAAERPRLIVKLKFGRKRRKDLERLLRLRPAPQRKEESVEKTKPNSRDEHVSAAGKPHSKHVNDVSGKTQKTKHQPDSMVKNSTSAKHDLPEEDDTNDLPSKRTKALKAADLDKNPQTPNSKTQHLSPAIHQRSGSKSNTHFTPLKAVPMSRSSSMDGTTSTPKVATATPPNTTSQELRPPTSAPHGDSQAEIQALNTAHRKFNDLGRKLKRDFDETFRRRASGETVSLAERRRGALKGLESVLCYIWAFSCWDASAKLRRSRPRLEHWRSIMPLHHNIVGLTKEFANLEAVRAMLGVAVTARVGSLLADAAGAAAATTTGATARPPAAAAGPPTPAAQNAAGPEQHESPSSTHSGTVSGAPGATTTAAAATAASAPPAAPDAAKEMADMFKALVHFLHETSIKLNGAVLAEAWPVTWGRRAEVPPRATWERHVAALAMGSADAEGAGGAAARRWFVGCDVAANPVQAGLLGLALLADLVALGDAAGYEVEIEGVLFAR